MISFKQLDTGTPPDIEVTTDDNDAELYDMTKAFEDADAEAMTAAENLRDAQVGADGNTTFVIPGAEAGEVAELFESADLGDLETFLDELRQKVLAAAEADLPDPHESERTES